MQRIALTGDWQVTDETTKESRAATVPGCVHLDLLADQALPDLWWRDNELQYHWVCERDWTYSRRFSLDAELLKAPQLRLHCEGLDTLATVLINGQEVLSADNMFRLWQVDVRDVVRAGENEIVVRFASTIPAMKAGDQRRHLPAWNCYHHDFAGKSYIRKMACAYGWDWGPMAPTAGIWRGIALHAFQWCLEDVYVRQQHDGGAVDLLVEASLSGAVPAGASMQVKVFLHDVEQVSATAELSDHGGQLQVSVPNPQLWWPNGMGEQVLYRVDVTVVDAAGQQVDASSKRIGLRTVDLVREQDEWGESFAFAVNGRHIFAKGANWIPADIFVPRLQRADYERLLGAAADAHMNCIRCWGGGIYEEAEFYEVCDELGLLVWQDFMFACSTYPTHEEDFMANVKQEAIDNIKRLRHHPSIFFWCGNNELEQGLADFKDPDGDWKEWAMPGSLYKKLFDDLLPDIVKEHDSERAYWPCSPHTPHGDRSDFNDPTCGDAHCWDVWFGGEPFEAQRKWLHRFMSEFGFQSFPEPRTCASFTEPEDRNLTSYVMDFHQRSTNRGNKTIFAYLLDWFQVPKDYENTLWMTQLTQALCIQYAGEHSRRMQPRMMGCVYWQINDIWPAATWSSIDVFGRWKALQYLAARFYAPVLVSGLEKQDDKTVEVHVSNHNAETFSGKVRWQVTDCAGQELASFGSGVTVDSQANVCASTVNCSDFLDEKGERDLLVWMDVEDADGQVLNSNLALFARPKHLQLRKPQLRTTVNANRITLSSDVPALWVRLELTDADARFSDNFFHVRANTPVTVTIDTALDEAGIKEQLRATSVVETWS